MASTSAALAIVATVLSPTHQECAPFECMPVEECVAFVYGLDLATDHATNSAIETICFDDEQEWPIQDACIWDIEPGEDTPCELLTTGE